MSDHPPGPTQAGPVAGTGPGSAGFGPCAEQSWTFPQIRAWLLALSRAELADDHLAYADAYDMAAGYLTDNPPWPLTKQPDPQGEH